MPAMGFPGRRRHQGPCILGEVAATFPIRLLVADGRIEQVRVGIYIRICVLVMDVALLEMHICVCDSLCF